MKKKVILFEDNKSFAEGLMMLFSTTDDLECSKSYTDPRFILEAIKTHQPDVILMDIDMPNMNGVEAVKLVRDAKIEIPIIMQTIFDDNKHIYDCIVAGANGYILKNTEPGKYIDAIRDVLNGGAPMTATIAAKVLSIIQKPKESKVKEEFNLSARESEILKLLVDGMSYKMIAEECHISYHTVNSHIRKIYDKLHVNNGTEAVSKAIKENLLSLVALTVLLQNSGDLLPLISS